jgi:hypothetical protein
MKKIKYTLKFVNDGKEFVLPEWNVQKHERAMVKAIEASKGNKEVTKDEKESMLKLYIILETLLEIDSTVEIEDVSKFFTHPENIVEFFNAVYYEGKHDIYFHQEEKPPKKRKGTTKKN